MTEGLASILCTFDDFVLDAFVQTREIGTEASHANNEISVVFRVVLCVLQGLGADTVELDMGSAEIAVSLDKRQQHPGTVGAGKRRGDEFDVEMVRTVLDGINSFGT